MNGLWVWPSSPDVRQTGVDVFFLEGDDVTMATMRRYVNWRERECGGGSRECVSECVCVCVCVCVRERERAR